MRYRRLGETQLMVSEVGLHADAFRDVEAETVEATLRAAIALGVTVVCWSVSDASSDLEPLIARAAGTDRGRLTLVAILDHVPAAEAVGPQVEAIASRLGSDLDVLALPGGLDAAGEAAFEDARGRGVVRFVAQAGDATIEAGGARMALLSSTDGVPAALENGVSCVLVPVRDPGELRALVTLPGLVA